MTKDQNVSEGVLTLYQRFVEQELKKLKNIQNYLLDNPQENPDNVKLDLTHLAITALPRESIKSEKFKNLMDTIKGPNFFDFFKKLESKGLDLKGLDLKGLNLSGVYFIEANLNGADLSNAYLYDAKLEGAKLEEANLSSAKLIGANLSGADLKSAKLMDVNLNWADLSGANLNKADLRRADLLGADLIGANLRDVNLAGANLSGADLRNVNLEGANLKEAKFAGVIENSIKVDINNSPLISNPTESNLKPILDILERGRLKESNFKSILDLLERGRLEDNQLKEMLGIENEVPASIYLDDLVNSISKFDSSILSGINKVRDLVKDHEERIKPANPSPNPQNTPSPNPQNPSSPRLQNNPRCAPSCTIS